MSHPRRAVALPTSTLDSSKARHRLPNKNPRAAPHIATWGTTLLPTYHNKSSRQQVTRKSTSSIPIEIIMTSWIRRHWMRSRWRMMSTYPGPLCRRCTSKRSDPSSITSSRLFQRPTNAAIHGARPSWCMSRLDLSGTGSMEAKNSNNDSSKSPPKPNKYHLHWPTVMKRTKKKPNRKRRKRINKHRKKIEDSGIMTVMMTANSSRKRARSQT